MILKGHEFHIGKEKKPRRIVINVFLESDNFDHRGIDGRIILAWMYYMVRKYKILRRKQVK
jgi:hypothetical protein